MSHPARLFQLTQTLLYFLLCPLRTLVTHYPAANLAVAVATDGTVYRNEVYEAATAAVQGSGSDAEAEALKHKEGEWRPVLILVAIRLGIDQLNPIYYPALKVSESRN